MNRMASRDFLTKPKIYVRIRPPKYLPSIDGSKDVPPLTSYSESEVELDTDYMFSSGYNTFTFMNQIFIPGIGQEEVYRSMNLTEYVAEFTKIGGKNISASKRLIGKVMQGIANNRYLIANS